MDEFSLVRRRHHRHVGQAGQIGEIERAGVGWAIGANVASAIDREAHRQVLNRDVVHHLIVGALEKGRVDRAERFVTLAGQSHGEGHRVLLGDPDIEDAVGIDVAEAIEAGA